MGFVPIRIPDYVRKHLKANRGETAEALTARLESALEAYQAGKRCSCGEPIWVIGSAEAGHACFTCITGEADRPRTTRSPRHATSGGSVLQRGAERRRDPIARNRGRPSARSSTA